LLIDDCPQRRISIRNPQSSIRNVMDWDEMAVVGLIARAHGIRGQVIVNAATDFPAERFRPGAELFVRRNGLVAAVRVSSVRFQHDRPVIGLEGVQTMTQAEALAGLELRVPADQLMALPPGTYYHHDLAGCIVETREGRRVGVVREVDASFGGSRLVVDGSRGEILIPLASGICVVVDVAAKRIVVDAPEGLLELNE
jgi:16S rRNA processing protein RimM